MQPPQAKRKENPDSFSERKITHDQTCDHESLFKSLAAAVNELAAENKRLHGRVDMARDADDRMAVAFDAVVKDIHERIDAWSLHNIGMFGHHESDVKGIRKQVDQVRFLLPEDARDLVPPAIQTGGFNFDSDADDARGQRGDSRSGLEDGAR